ncbi:MAG: Diaminopimelate epimerase [Firmicutes bacterium]|nr:Diaminopimelate epimerase [Bacillota bacterium]
MKFTKWQGIGNDFVIVNGFQEKIDDYPSKAIEICDRHFGIGADGLVIALPSEIADFRMRIFNSDGSEAEMCGNVTRCFARYVYENGLTTKTELTIETLAGIIKPRLLFDGAKISAVCVDMGEPRLKRGEIPMTGDPDDQAVNIPLIVGDAKYDITCVSMGNPHCIIFSEEAETLDLQALGRPIEVHPMFPRKTNVEFVRVINRQTIRMRVWERGAGITLACGTGTCAAVVAAVLNDKTDRQVLVHLDGGDLFIEWRADNHIYKTGPAVEVFRGEYLR